MLCSYGFHKIVPRYLIDIGSGLASLERDMALANAPILLFHV